MKRTFKVIVECEFDMTSPFDYDDIVEGLKEVFTHEHPITCNGFYYNALGWSWVESTDPDDIAQQVACELSEYSEELGASEHDVLFTQRIGDNGTYDVGYEIRWLSNPQVLFDIGIKMDNGIWSVVFSKYGKDIPISCVEDLVEEYQMSIRG
jgi:hypothetical protein